MSKVTLLPCAGGAQQLRTYMLRMTRRTMALFICFFIELERPLASIEIYIGLI